MKKIFTAILMMLMLTCSLAFGQTYANYPLIADKVLQPDGSIVSIISGTTWAPADAGRANQYRTAPVLAAKYLMPDGSIINGVPITTTITGTATAGYCIMVNAAGGLVYAACPATPIPGVANDPIWNVMGDMAIATGPDAANIANIGEQRVVGRLTGENVKGLAVAEMKTLLGYPTLGEYQVNLGLLAGTLTDGFLCTYTATGTLLDCNTNSASFQPAGAYQADMGITAKSDSVGTTSSTSVASSTAVKTAYDLASGRQVNLGLVAGTLTNGFICTYTSAGTLLDCNTDPGVFQADMGITGRTDSTSTTSSTLVATATAVKSAYDLAGAAATAANWPGSSASPPAIGKTTPAELWGSPNVAKGPAIINSGFTGTISRSTTTLTFSEAADAILAGYSATNPILGTTVIHPTGPVTMYITAWLSSTTATVDSSGTLAAQTPTSFQLPIATFVNSAGVTQGWMNAAGNVYFPSGFISDIRIVESSGKLKWLSGGSTPDAYIQWASGASLLFNTYSLPIVFSPSSVEAMRISATSGNILTGGLTAAGTSAAKVLAMGEATAPTTSPANAAQLWPENLDANGGNNRFWTRTEDGVHSPLAIKSETDAQANPKAPSQGVNMTYAASDSTGIAVGDDANIDFGTGNFTLVWKGSLPDWTPSAATKLIQKYEDASHRVSLYTGVDGILTVNLNGTVQAASTAYTFVDGTQHEVVVVGTVGAVNTTLDYYGDGVAIGTQQSITNVGSLSNTGAFYILGDSTSRTAGTTHHAYTFNRALTAAEVLDLYRNGVSFADKWGSQTAVADYDGTSGHADFTPQTRLAVTSNESIGGSNALKFTIDNSSDSHFAALPAAKLSKPLANKRFRISGSYYIPTQTALDGFKVSDNGGEILINLATVTLDGWTAFSVDTATMTPTATGIQFVALDGGITTVNDPGGDDYFAIKDFLVTEIGATLALEEKGIWLDKWYDSTTNNLVASYPTVGWNLTQQANKKRVKQPTPTAETTAVTLTIAKLLTGIITATHTAGATQAYTLPTGALTDAWPAFGIDDYFDWYLINLSAAAADTVTVTAAATGHTIVGNPIVQSAHSSTGGVMGNSAGFRTVKTAAATFISYRIN